jgi:hypothetical protein
MKHHIGTSFCPSSPEETMLTGVNTGHDMLATGIRQRDRHAIAREIRGGGVPEVFGYPTIDLTIEAGDAQQARPPSSGTITPAAARPRLLMQGDVPQWRQRQRNVGC